MKHPELLAPAGSFESIRAAVQSGADAVYFGFGTFNARRGATGFTRKEMLEAMQYCRARGVKTNITFNIVASDRERENALEDIAFLNEADALIVQDIGLARLIRRHAPDLPLHASTQMTVHSLDGALEAKELGFSRVVLSRELPLTEIRRITECSGVETEVFIHGALCMCYSGQCYLSAMIGQRSGNRGLCAQPCRLPYSYERGKACYPLSLKDLSLAHHLQEICDAGVASLKIEGRMKRPAYTAIVTKIYADLLRERREPTAQEDEILARVFSRDGFTDGYFTGEKCNMFGTKTELPLSSVQNLYDEAASRFAKGKEAPLVPISMHFEAGEHGLRLEVQDGKRFCMAQDEQPIELALHRSTTEEQIEKSLQKTGGTPFAVHQTEIILPDGLMIPASRINALRRDALEKLLARRGEPPARRFIQPDKGTIKSEQNLFEGYTVEARSFAQAEAACACISAKTVYLPLEVLASDCTRTTQMCAQGVPLAAVLPRIFFDREAPQIEAMLQRVKNAGVQTLLGGNLGHFMLAQRVGMQFYGDFGLNVFNSDALAAYTELGAERLTLSFELMGAQLRDLIKPVTTEMLVYGYLPLMIFENCAIRRQTGACACKGNAVTITDRTGKSFALLPEFGCRNTMLNSQPLVLARQEFDRLGVSFARLKFTTETPARCREIADCFANNQAVTAPEGVTRGLYRRGVE